MFWQSYRNCRRRKETHKSEGTTKRTIKTWPHFESTFSFFFLNVLFTFSLRTLCQMRKKKHHQNTFERKSACNFEESCIHCPQISVHCVPSLLSHGHKIRFQEELLCVCFFFCSFALVQGHQSFFRLYWVLCVLSQK